MSLEKLKKRKPSKHLDVKEKDLKKLNPSLIYELELPEHFSVKNKKGETEEILVRVEHSKKEVEKNNRVIIPVFSEERLLPFTYTQMKKGKVVATYSPYSNYLGWEYVYKKGDLLQIKYTQGIRVLKHSEEMYLKTIALEETNLNFRFDKEKAVWVFIQDEEKFNELRLELEEELKSKEVVELTKKYFTLRDNYEKYIEEVYAESYEEGYQKVEELFDIIYDFHFLMNVAGDIFDYQFTKIDEEIKYYRERHKIIHGKFLEKDAFATKESEENNFISNIAELKSDFKALLKSNKYYIYKSRVGPGIGAYYASKQKAADNRTPELKEKLEAFILQRAAKLKVDTINMYDQRNINAYNEFIKK